jgi:hypothetical protein
MEKGIRGGDMKAMEKRRKWRKEGNGEGKEMEKVRRWRREGDGRGKET